MNNKYTGVTLLEILVVLAIFTVVSIGVTNLTVKTMEFQKDKETAIYQTNILNSIQGDLRRDLLSAYYVWVTNGSTPTLSGTNTFSTIQACGTTPTNVSGTDLNIVQLVNYTAGPPESTSFRYIRYEFRNVDGVPSIVRTSNPAATAGTPISVAASPDKIWPKTLDGTQIPLPNSFSTYSAGTSKVYNPTDVSREIETISGSFQVVFGEGVKAADGSWAAPNCTYNVRSITVSGLTIQPDTSNYRNVYDKAFGSKNRIVSPELSFEVNSSVKFF